MAQDGTKRAVRRADRRLQLALFAAAISWGIAAMGLATRAARGLVVRFQWSDEFFLLNAIFFLFLLGIGFVTLEAIAARGTRLRLTLGLPRRPTTRKEWATGAAIGWGVILLSLLPMALARTLHVRFWLEPRSFWLAGLNVVTFAVASLATEIAFRGYPFRRLIDAIGPAWAAIVMSLIYGLISTFGLDSSYLGSVISVVLGIVLGLAWLRTHGLWLGWGLHFAWIVSLGVLFGLPVNGVDNLSSLVQTRAIGPVWLTGGEFGVEGALPVLLLLLGAIAVLVFVTRDWAWDYTRKPLIPAGYPMDVPPPAAHEAIAKQAPAVALVQILPSTPQNRSAEPDGQSSIPL